MIYKVYAYRPVGNSWVKTEGVIKKVFAFSFKGAYNRYARKYPDDEIVLIRHVGREEYYKYE